MAILGETLLRRLCIRCEMSLFRRPMERDEKGTGHGGARGGEGWGQ